MNNMYLTYKNFFKAISFVEISIFQYLRTKNITRPAAQLHNQHVFRKGAFLVPLCAISNFCELDVLPYEFLNNS